MDSHIHPDTKCPFGCSAIDNVTHLFGDCKYMAWENVNAIRQTFSLPPVPVGNRVVGTLLGATQHLSRLEATLNAFLLFTTWEARTCCLNNDNFDVPLFYASTIAKLVSKHCPAVLKMANIKNLQAPFKPIASGSSGKRTNEQIALISPLAEAEKIISSFSPNDIIAYTDVGKQLHKSNSPRPASMLQWLAPTLPLASRNASAPH